MTEPHVLSQLKSRAEKIRQVITAYEGQIKEARRDLMHVNATIRLFEIGDKRLQFPVHMDSRQMFKPRELGTLCKEALAEHGPMTTRELALHVIKLKGMDAEDKVLRQAVAYRIVQSLSMLWRRGKLESDGKRDGVRIWRNLFMAEDVVRGST